MYRFQKHVVLQSGVHQMTKGPHSSSKIEK